MHRTVREAPSMAERDYQRSLNIIRNEVETASAAFYTYLAVHQFASESAANYASVGEGKYVGEIFHLDQGCGTRTVGMIESCGAVYLSWLRYARRTFST